MKKNELKKILKPLIKECIKEVIFEENGALSHIISEVACGLSSSPKKVVRENTNRNNNAAKTHEVQNEALKRHRKKLLDAIGKDAYNGVDLFEGTTPAPAASTQSQGALSGVSPNDPGVDIGSVFSGKSSAIFNKMMEKK